MSDSIKERVEGAADKLKGKVRETTGDITDDPMMTREGVVDQGKGEAKQRAADAKDRAKGTLNDTFNKVTDH